MEDERAIEEIAVRCPGCKEEVAIDDMQCPSCGAILIGAETLARGGIMRMRKRRHWGVYGVLVFLLCPPLGIIYFIIQKLSRDRKSTRQEA